MTKIFKGIALFAIALLLITACESDNQSLLTDGVWNFSNMTTDSDSQDIISLITLGKALMTDATLEFKADKTYIITAPLLQEPETGTWSLIGDDTLVMSNDDDPGGTANIEVLTKKELKYITTIPNTEMNSFNMITTTWSRD